MVLEVEVLCALSIPEVCQCEVLIVASTLRKIIQEARYFVLPEWG